MPASLGLLWFGLLKLVAGVALVLVLASLGPAVWADPPLAPRPRGAARPDADAVALLRAAERGDALESQHAARAALEERFPPGSDPAALVAFLTAEGWDRSAHCERDASEHRYYCRIHYGSLAASVLGLHRWRAQEWVVNVALTADSGAVERISVRRPFLGKG